MTKRILIMAGGTGGHVFPGLAVATELLELDWQVHWLGAANRMEAKIVPAKGIDISYIDVAGVRGNGLIRLLKAPFQIARSIFQARKVMKSFAPDVVLGMGGFASGPGGIAAWLMGIPLILHEQNAVPGLTNKILSRFAQKVFTGFDNTFAAQNKLPSKYQWVGNPVRKEFFTLQQRENVQGSLNILVVGGSLGAKALNEEVPKALAQIREFNVRHQCGAGHLNAVHDTYQGMFPNQDNWRVDEFIEDMADAYQWADLVICRAGALTVAEVAAAGVAAVFVPLPHAVDDHQTKNAMALSSKQAAYLLPQNKLIQGELVPILKQGVDAPASLQLMGQKAKALAKSNASQDVARSCVEITEQAA